MPLRHLKCLLLLLLLVFSTNGVCQTAPYTWDWAEEAYTTNTEFANDVAIDPVSGDIVVVGEFTGDISAFYGPQFVAAVGGGFVAKYNSAGTLIWAFRIGGNNDDRCKSVAIDATGNIYVAGYLTNFADFRGNSGSSQLLTSAGGRDAFIAKYNSAGMFQWGKLGGGTNNDEAYSVAVGGSTVYITGYYNTAANFGVLTTHAVQSRDNVFLVAYNPTTGNELWLADGGVTSDGYGYDVIANANAVFITGSLNGNITFYNAAGVNCGTPVTSGNWEGFTASYTNTGNFNWASIVSGGGVNKCYSLTLLGSNVYITGATQNNTDFTGYAANPLVPPGSSLDFFLAQLNSSNGFANWVVCESGNNTQEGLQITNDGTDIIVCGSTESTLSFFTGPTLTSLGSTDVFVAKYTTGGSFVWAQQAGGTSSEFPYGIASITTGDIYVVGEYRAAATFGTFSLFNEPSINIFVANLSCAPISNNTITSSQTICSGQTPATLVGSTPTGGSTPYVYFWEESTDNISWSPAVLINNTQNYSPPSLTSTKYYRRTVTSSGGCPSTSTSSSILITVDQPPTTASAGSDQNICASSTTLLANTPTTGTGTWTLVSGTGTITTPSSPSSGTTGMLPGVNIFQWAITSGTCPGSADQVTITVDAMPTVADAGSDQTICSLSTSLLGNTATSGSGIWTLVSGTGTITTPTSPTSGITGMLAGANIFQWTITSGTCPSSFDQITINVTAPPTPAAAGVDQTICSSSTSLLGNTPTVGTGLWTLVSGTGTITTPTSPTSGITAMSSGANVFQWTITNGTCPSSFDQVTINSSSLPTTAAAGNDQTICASSTSLLGNTVTTGTGIWTLVSGTGTITTATSPNSGITAMSAGANIFQWTITSGTCPSSFDQVTINVTAPPTTADAGNDQTICSSSTSLLGNTATVGTGIWTLISGTGTITTSSSPTSGVTGMLSGTNIFQWAITNGICPTSFDTMVVSVDSIPTIANAGTDHSLCASNDVHSGNTPTIGSGTWSLVSGSGTLTNPTSAVSSISGMLSGANIFAWTITNGTCPASVDSITITVDSLPNASAAGADQTICTSSTSLVGNTATAGAGMWTLISGTGIITTTSSPTSGVTGMLSGTNIFQWAITNGTCPTSFDTVVVAVDSIPTTANAGTDHSLCASNDIHSGNTPTIGSGTWSLISGSGTVTNPTSAVSPISGMSSGANIFAWTITNGTCPASVDSITITVDSLPNASAAGADQIICSNQDTLAGNIPTVGAGTWTLLSGTGTITTPSSPSSTITDMYSGPNVFVWTISNGVCPTTSDTVSFTVDSLPNVAYAGLDQQFCSSSYSLNGNTPTIGTGLWTLLSGSGNVTVNNSSSSGITGLGIGPNVFQWTISNGTCPSSSDTVVLTIDPTPTQADAGIDQIICASSTTLYGNTNLVGTGVWNLVSGSGTITSPNSPTSSIIALSPGANIFEWTITSGTCPPSTDQVWINVEPTPTIADAGPDQTVDIPLVVLGANNPQVGLGFWEVVSGPIAIPNPFDPNCVLRDVPPGHYIFRWSIVGVVCDSTSDDVEITVNEFVIPNGFSPNDDNINDNFIIPGVGYWPQFNLNVYNRWGELVYFSKDYQNEWNGQNQNGDKLVDDTYYYVLEIPTVGEYAGFVVVKREK